MSTFTLNRIWEEDNRLAIFGPADKQRGAIEREVHADSWLHAKQKLGYPLTPLQHVLREREKEAA